MSVLLFLVYCSVLVVALGIVRTQFNNWKGNACQVEA